MVSMNSTPPSLLQKLRQPSDQQAWERFVELYTPLLYRWARGVGLQDQDAADLLQDVFAGLVLKLPEFEYDRHKSFRAWLRTVTLNQWRNNQKRVGRQPLARDPDTIATLAVEDERLKAASEDEYRQVLAGKALALMRAEFQPNTWKACWEFVVMGRPAVEVARELGISENAVYIAKSRVLRRLRQELEGLWD